MTNTPQKSLAAIAKKVDPLEKPPSKVDMIMTEPCQEKSPLLPVVTENSKVIETDLIVSLKHHPIELSSSQRRTEQSNAQNEA